MGSGKVSSGAADTATWYQQYYARKGHDRNDLLTNPEVLFQHLATEDSAISALRRAAGLHRNSSRVLDVGCGDGGSLTRFLKLGFSPDNLHGLDILRERITDGHSRFPNVRLACGDATAMPYESEWFDLVMEATMFVQVTDESVARGIAGEMLRVLRPGGYLLLLDWRYAPPGDPTYVAVSRRRIRALFLSGSSADVVCERPGALVPPVGRALSRYLPSLYFLIRALFPFLVGAKATLLRKRGG